jgi:hypothetical protein
MNDPQNNVHLHIIQLKYFVYDRVKLSNLMSTRFEKIRPNEIEF